MEIFFILLAMLGTSAVSSMFDTGAAGNPSDDDTPRQTPDVPKALISSGVYDGGAGDNEIRAAGDATVLGGQGRDQIWAGDEAISYGGAGQDNMVLSGNASGYGGWGDDTLTAWGASEANGDAGNDVLDVGYNASGKGGSGNDTLIAAGNVWGGEGDDTFILKAIHTSSIQLYGGAGNDTFDAVISNEEYEALSDAQQIAYIESYPQGSAIYGGAGHDAIQSGEIEIGASYGGTGDDTIDAYAGTAFGDEGNDIITAHLAYGGAGDDSVNGGAYGTAHGDDGDDTLIGLKSFGGAGNDMLRLNPFFGEGYMSGAEAYGGDGDDTLRGVTGHIYDTSEYLILWGGAGNDVIYAEGGNQVDAGIGNDTVLAATEDYALTSDITLGEGADSFVMALAPEDLGNDLGIVDVQDFNPAEDHLALIVDPNDFAALQVTITPNALGGNTVVTITAPDSSVATYDFKGITSLDASAIKLYADQTAVLAGTSYGNLA